MQLSVSLDVQVWAFLWTLERSTACPSLQPHLFYRQCDSRQAVTIYNVTLLSHLCYSLCFTHFCFSLVETTFTASSCPLNGLIVFAADRSRRRDAEVSIGSVGPLWSYRRYEHFCRHAIRIGHVLMYLIRRQGKTDKEELQGEGCHMDSLSMSIWCTAHFVVFHLCEYSIKLFKKSLLLIWASAVALSQWHDTLTSMTSLSLSPFLLPSVFNRSILWIKDSNEIINNE